MSPIDIKYALERAGLTQADVARMCQVAHRQTVSAVIHSVGRSRQIEEKIATLLGLSLAEIWPHWHGPEARRRKRPLNVAELSARVKALEARLAAKAA